MSDMNDKTKLIELVRAGVSLDEVERGYAAGWIEGPVLRAYEAVWNWSAPRYGGVIGGQHDAYYRRHGAAAYYRRINRVRVAFGLVQIEHHGL